jgi:hypothetical protein
MSVVLVIAMVMVTVNINKVFVVHQLVECCVLPRWLLFVPDQPSLSQFKD